MNLIQQLQKTRKWKRFEKWYNKQSYFIRFNGYYQLHQTFIELPFDFQKGVFEKFIESRGYNIEKGLWDFLKKEKDDMDESQILKLRFKEKWFIRSSVIVDNYYTSFCLNPLDNITKETIVFNSFEELLIWYFNN